MSPSSSIVSVQKFFSDFERRQLNDEQIVETIEKQFQLSSNESNCFVFVDFIEKLFNESKFSEKFLELFLLASRKNAKFFQSFLVDHQRFQRIFTRSNPKSTQIIRFFDLIYFHCPECLIESVALQFFRFIVDRHLNAIIKSKEKNLELISDLSTFFRHFDEKQNKNPSKPEPIFVDSKDCLQFSTSIIDTFLHCQPSKNNFHKELKQIENVLNVVQLIWFDRNSAENSFNLVQLQSVEYLFLEMSRSSTNKIYDEVFKRTLFSPFILTIYSRIHLDAAESALKTMYIDGRLNGQRLSNLIRALIQLIDSPPELMQSMSYEIWLTGLFTALVSYDQHQYLTEIIDQTTKLFIDHLFSVNERTAENALQILFWFVRYDRRIETFLRILDRLPTLFERFLSQPNDDLQSKSIELCHVALLIHSNFDRNKNSFVKTVLESWPHPDLNILSNHRNYHARLHCLNAERITSVPNRIGIINLGNTCYINSVLQSLYQSVLFRTYLLEHHLFQTPVIRELQLVFAQLKLSKKSFINAIDFVKVARPPWFLNQEQQDCAEFLGYLLDTVKDEEKSISSTRSPSETEKLFTIRTRQINQCRRCLTESSRDESTNYLFLPIPTSEATAERLNHNESARPFLKLNSGLKFYTSENRNALSQEEQLKQISTSLVTSIPVLSKNELHLQTIFDHYFQKEELKGDNQYRCEFCRTLQDAERYTIIQTSPEYLILSLNRFEYDKRTNVFRKVFTKIIYPKILNINVHSMEDDENQVHQVKYCLVLVIVHTGYTLHGGHYYVYGREVKPLPVNIDNDNCEDYFLNDEWFLINDDLVTESSYQALVDNCSQYTAATPYILFYQRIDQDRLAIMRQSPSLNVHQTVYNQVDKINLN